jgi:oligopeptide/dipeptide ABC transporter ATP-binding protein
MVFCRVAAHGAALVNEPACAGDFFLSGASLDYRHRFRAPLHPYTRGLIGCIPTLKTDSKRLYVIEGNIPDPGNLPSGCHFHPRCAHAMDICREQPPAARLFGERHYASCHLAGRLETHFD